MAMKLLLVALKDEFTRKHHTALGKGWIVVYTGVGKLNAMYKAIEAIDIYKPELVVNYGTAGGINDAVTGLVEINRVCQRDMNAEPKSPRGLTPFEDSTMYLGNAVGGYRCGTGDSFVSAADPWHDSYCDVVDMEGYAIVDACVRKKVPWRMFKYVSDKADADGFETWKKNIANGAEAFVEAAKNIS